MQSWNERFARRLVALLAAVAVAIAGAARAQTQGDPPPFKPEEIEALVAPIALYPDSLLSQVLMASTYPLEIVQAARWVKANPNIKGDAAVKAVESQTWDVSVKSLVAFPQVLEPMNEKLDWTQKLGDAFLADQKAVLDAVQRLRPKADQSGNLKSTEQQKVIIEEAAPQQTVIKIEPAQPAGDLRAGLQPDRGLRRVGLSGLSARTTGRRRPYYYPGGALVAGFAWGVGIAAAGALFGGCNWGRGDVNINVNRATNIDRNFNSTKVGGGGQWQHDASHRKGVSYRDHASREKFGKDVPGAAGRNDFRGRDGGPGDRAGAGDRGGPGDRGGAGDRGGPAMRWRVIGAAAIAVDRAWRSRWTGTGDRGGAGVADRGGPGHGRSRWSGRSRRAASVADRGGPGAGGRDNAFQGVGGGAASQRDHRPRSRQQSVDGESRRRRRRCGRAAERRRCARHARGGERRGGGGARWWRRRRSQAVRETQQCDPRFSNSAAPGGARRVARRCGRALRRRGCRWPSRSRRRSPRPRRR